MFRLRDSILVAIVLSGCLLPDERADPKSSALVEGGAAAAGPSQTGQVIDKTLSSAVPGVTVKAQDVTAQGDEGGKYELKGLKPDLPFQMVVSANGFYTLTEQEWFIKKAVDRGRTRLVSNASGNALNGILENVDANKGLLSAGLELLGCPSQAGATIEISPAGTSERAYIGEVGVPDKSVKAALKMDSPHVIFWNVDVGVPITVTVKHPTCTVAPFPVEVEGFTYTSATTKVLPGKALSFVRVFLK